MISPRVPSGRASLSSSLSLTRWKPTRLALGSSSVQPVQQPGAKTCRKKIMWMKNVLQKQEIAKMILWGLSTAWQWHSSETHFNNGILAKLIFKDGTYVNFSMAVGDHRLRCPKPEP